MDARIRIFLYTLTSQYQNQSFSARALLTNPLRCPDTNRIRVDGCIRFVYATCGRRYFCIRIKKFADTKISGHVIAGQNIEGSIFPALCRPLRDRRELKHQAILRRRRRWEVNFCSGRRCGVVCQVIFGRESFHFGDVSRT